jgi:energy-coupling factor transport system permease protein
MTVFDTLGPVRAAPEWTAPLLLGGMVGSLVAGRFETALLCVAVVTVAAWAAGASRPSRSWFTAMLMGLGLALFLNLYLNPGRRLPLPALLGLEPTDEGLRYGALLGLRLIGTFVALHGLRAAWPGERAADELARAFAPLERLRVPVRESRVVIGLALRFAPLLLAESRRIAALQSLRAGRRARGPWEWLERRRAAAIPTLVGALEHAERVALTLEARHYRVRPLPAGPRPHPGWRALGWGLAGAALLWRR